MCVFVRAHGRAYIYTHTHALTQYTRTHMHSQTQYTHNVYVYIHTHTHMRTRTSYIYICTPHFSISLSTLYHLSYLTLSHLHSNIISPLSHIFQKTHSLYLLSLLKTHIPTLFLPLAVPSLLSLFPFSVSLSFPLSSLSSFSLSLVISHSWHMMNLLYL